MTDTSTNHVAVDPAVAAWPDLAGRIVDDVSGRHHALPVRVYFEDTDAGGIAYHASYIRWCERGRTDFLRLLGTKETQDRMAHMLKTGKPLRN